MLDEVFLSDCKIIVKGLWDRELPPINNSPTDSGYKYVFEQIELKNEYGLFVYSSSTDTLVTKITDFTIHNGGPKGTETSKFYSYKNNNSLRQMGLVNPILYLAFAYNTAAVKDSFYLLKYLNFQYYEHSLSPVFANTDFYITEDFYGEYEENYELEFLVNIFGFEKMKEKTKEEEQDYLYSLKIDVSNFYSNIYTHHLERIGKKYNTFELHPNDLSIDYFSFLDKFSQRTNLSQTKGITPGPYSSTLCAELLMCEIDKRICKDLIKDEKIGYLRNVDDMTFYSDSREKLASLLDKLQILLFEYELSINESKTKIEQCALEYEEDLKDEIEQCAKHYCDDKGSLDSLDALKANIAKAIAEGKKSLSKAILSKIKGTIDENPFEFVDPKYSVNYFYKLGLTEKYLGSRCFKIIDSIMSCVTDCDVVEAFVNSFIAKTGLINSSYNSSIIQVWHFYLINKYGNESQIDSAFDLYSKQVNVKNPIVLMTFVRKGDGTNRRVFDIIKKQERLSNEKLFYTCFAPLLLSIYAVDKANYDNYLDNLPQIIYDLYNN